MKSKFNAVLAAAMLCAGASGLAVAAADTKANAQSESATAVAASQLTAGEVRKVDAAQGKLTIRHEPIVNLDMPAMTMVFRADAGLLKDVNAGDRILFRAEKREAGFTIVQLERAK